MFIPVAQPSLSKKERGMLLNAFDSGWIAKGSYIKEFENKIAKYFSKKYCICVANGSFALEMAIRSLEINKQNILNISSSCVSSANSIIHSFNNPIFCDADMKTFQMDTADFKNICINKNIKTAIITPLYGGSPNYCEILNFTRKNKIKIIEDCSQSMGAKYDGKLLGTFGELAVFSFYSNKIITSGEGGAIITDNKKLAGNLKTLRNQGQIAPFVSSMLGNNYKISNLLAAIGSAQMDRIDEFISKRRKNAEYLINELQEVNDIVLPINNSKIYNVYFSFPIKLKNKKIADIVIKYLNDNGIETRNLFQPMNTQKYFKKIYPDYNANHKNAMLLFKTGFYVSCSPCLTKIELGYIVKTIKKGIEYAKN
ncbi:MAG TPA: DegT/DnrJ/EryC1/StrS aminotransferase family protein [bacterium]|nr:DegT/DnrJ/EryC1/StrS aminotransferase family protein [bacterium]